LKYGFHALADFPHDGLQLTMKVAQLLTLPGLKTRGFLVQSVDLLVDVTTKE